MVSTPSPIRPSSTKPGLLTLTIKDRSAHYLAYMPFVKNGGLFIPTNSNYRLDDEVRTQRLDNPPQAERLPVVEGQVQWQATASATRATAELIMAIWFIFAGLWMLWESRNLREQDAGGIDRELLRQGGNGSACAIGRLLDTKSRGDAADFGIGAQLHAIQCERGRR